MYVSIQGIEKVCRTGAPGAAGAIGAATAAAAAARVMALEEEDDAAASVMVAFFERAARRMIQLRSQSSTRVRQRGETSSVSAEARRRVRWEERRWPLRRCYTRV